MEEVLILGKLNTSIKVISDTLLEVALWMFVHDIYLWGGIIALV